MDPASILTRLGLEWFAVKSFIDHALAFHEDGLHVLGGVLLQLSVAALLRRSLGAWLPWLAVLVVELVNEWADLSLEIWPDRAMQWGESGRDLFLTLALPTVLLLLSRYAPRLLVATSPAPPE
jgi:hypothetical protein